MGMMVEQTVKESGRDARGSFLSSAYVWTSSKVLLRIVSSTGKSDSQKARLTTLVFVSSLVFGKIGILFEFDSADNKMTQESPNKLFISVFLCDVFPSSGNVTCH